MALAVVDDARILASTNAEDFAVFYRRHVGAATSFAGRYFRAPDVILDIVAETFARALERREQYRPERGPAVAWLLGIERNLILDAFEHQRVDQRARARLGLPRIVLDDEQAASVARRSELDLLTELTSLPYAQREAVFRRVVIEESYEAIAASVGSSQQVVRQRVSRGLNRLRRRFEESS
jgi:RNA polymerase sigma factor (sigma-70 family)